MFICCDAKLLGAKMDLPNRQLCWPFDTLLAILRQLAFDRVFWEGLKSLSHFVLCFLTYLTYINWICICTFAKNVWKHSSNVFKFGHIFHTLKVCGVVCSQNFRGLCFRFWMFLLSFRLGTEVETHLRVVWRRGPKRTPLSIFASAVKDPKIKDPL